MDELIKLVSKKTGIPEAQAKIAVETVMDFLKKKLPAPIAAQLDAVITGGGAQNLMDGLGGMLNKR